MKLNKLRSSIAGFTLIDTLVGSLVSSLVLGSVVVGSVAMRRSLSIANYHVVAQNEQLRIIDYLGKDLRSASTVQVLDGGRRIDLTVPNANPNLLAISVELPVVGSLQTTSIGATRAVSYYLEGDRLIREDEGVQTELAQTVADFSIQRSGASANVTTVFSPRFSNSREVSEQRELRFTSLVFLRSASGS